MTTSRAALILLFLLAASTFATAQDAKPWLRPGTRPGEEIYGPNDGQMVWVPAGEFMMGSNDGKADERPVHQVRLSRGFWMSKFEVTIAQWLDYCREAGVLLKVKILAPANTHPMWGLAWDDVKAYCRFYGLSMPTEAQWEWAARGPEGRKYPWGNQWDETLCCNNDNNGDDGITLPVGTFPGDVSWCGVRDMGGNLSEWCEDWYAEDYYAKSPAVDPTGPDTGKERVQRGGYFWGDADWCRSARRFSDDPTNNGGAGCARPCYTP
ncbi:MAG: SUMF1/EgtB/PvdO family nonheme iron enzyme [Armatimonadia bacterium]